MPHYYSTSDWWVAVFLRFQSACSGHKLSSLHVKKCSFHVTLPYKNGCKNYTNNDVDSHATPKWYIKHDRITVLLLEALERRRNASALPALPHEKGSFCGTFLHKESVDVLWACWGLLGLVGLVGSLLGLVGRNWECGFVWNLTLRESQLWLIKFWPNSLFPRFCGVSLGSCHLYKIHVKHNKNLDPEME